MKERRIESLEIVWEGVRSKPQTLDERMVRMWYSGMGFIGEGFYKVLQVVTAPLVLEAKLLDYISERYLGDHFDITKDRRLTRLIAEDLKKRREL